MSTRSWTESSSGPVEVYPFTHAADGAAGLRDAAAPYRELAGALRLCIAVGGRLDSADDGMSAAHRPAVIEERAASAGRCRVRAASSSGT